MDDFTINGNKFWPKSVISGLLSKTFQNRIYEFYCNTPANLYDSLVQNTLSHPNDRCIIDDSGTVYCFADVLKLTDRFADLLRQSFHCKSGTHIGLLLYNSVEFCTAFLAAQKLRAIAVPLPTKYKRPELLSLAGKSDLDVLICEEQFAGWFRQDAKINFRPAWCFDKITVLSFRRLPSISGAASSDLSAALPEDAAILMFTSGTSSRSKGVMLYNYNIMHAVSVYQKLLNITREDRTIIPVPIYHVTGLIALFGLFLHAGGQIYLHRLFDAPRILADIQKNHISFLHGSPTVFSLLLMQAHNYPSLPSLRACACGSGNMPPQKILELHRWIPQMEFHTVYGLTETASPASVFPSDAAISPFIGSSGRPIPGTMFRICDDNGNILPPGKIGTVMIYGTVVLPEYYKMKNTPGCPLQNGWLDTGDLGYFNTEGYLYLTDRKKDMINRGGEKICSFDVENALHEINGIREAAVIGIPDPLYGEVPAAAVSLQAGAGLTPEKIREFLMQKLAKYQIPMLIQILPELPLTSGNKIDKNALRQEIHP